MAQAVQPPEIAARAYLLLDVTANQVLAAKDPDMAVEPASLTKLMTAYLVFDALRAKKIAIDQKIQVSERAWKMPGSRMFIDPKMQVPVEDLIKGMVVQSGNDATVLLAEAVGGTVERFVQLMNEQAKALGMNNTGYKNPEGLTEPGHTTTARDLGLLATRLMREFPQYTSYYAIKKYRYPGTPAANDTNRNSLLFRDPTVDGLKTGHTDAAGYCLIATAQRDFPTVGKRRLLSVVLGTSNENARAAESQKLLNWGYTAFDAIKLFDASRGVAARLEGQEQHGGHGPRVPHRGGSAFRQRQPHQDLSATQRPAGGSDCTRSDDRNLEGHAARPALCGHSADCSAKRRSSRLDWPLVGRRASLGEVSLSFELTRPIQPWGGHARPA
jgi:serine-type D-Ala-D-Ala carboxypeptidase (penicillin-binding protein 5/6)